MKLWRLAFLVVLFAIVQVTVFTHLRILGVVPDLGLVLAVAIAYRSGPEAGALTGFAAGLCYDIFLETPLGLSALSYALTGYAIGLLAGGMLRSPRWIPPVLGAAGGLIGGLCFIGNRRTGRRPRHVDGPRDRRRRGLRALRRVARSVRVRPGQTAFREESTVTSSWSMR